MLNIVRHAHCAWRRGGHSARVKTQTVTWSDAGQRIREDNEEDSHPRREARGFSVAIPVPSKLDIRAPRDSLDTAWRKFRRRWYSYGKASRLGDEAKDYRTAVLPACIGEEEADVFVTFTFDKERDKEDTDMVLEKFEQYCVTLRSLSSAV